MGDLFIELLQIALGGREVLSRVPSADEWIALYQESQRQAVLSLMVDGLERLPKEQLPRQDLLLQWIGLVQLNEGAYHLHCERAKELSFHLREKGYPSSVLKGIGFAQYYPTPSHRQCGDIDMWVGGDRKEVMDYLKKEYEISGVVWHHTVVHIFKDAETEIHFSPIWLHNPFHNKRLQKWFESSKDEQMVVDERLGFAYPAVEFNAVYSLLHSYHHLIEEGLGLRHIVDFFYILKSLPDEQRSCVVQNLKRFGLFKYTSGVIWVLKDILGMSDKYMICTPNEKEGRFLLDEMMRGGNFGHFRTDSLQHNSVSRMTALFPHYAREVLWVVPWKLWHKCWRLLNRQRDMTQNELRQSK